MSRESIEQGLRARLGDFMGFGYRVAFDLGDDGVIAVDGAQNPPVIEEDAGEVACTIRVSVENMEKLVAGSLNPMLAYTLGKLKVEGSMGVAMKMAALLEAD